MFIFQIFVDGCDRRKVEKSETVPHFQVAKHGITDQTA